MNDYAFDKKDKPHEIIYDVIIIGAGISGLMAAEILLK